MKFLVNSFVKPIMWLINFKFIYKKCKQYLIEMKDKINYNQKELNELYELQPMNIASKYAYIVKTLLMSFLYILIFPLGLGISLIGFIFGYWLEKFIFSKMYKKPEKLDNHINEIYMNYFVVIFWAYGIGNYYFLNDAYENNTWVLVNFLSFGLIIVIPFHSLFRIDFFKFKESEIHKKNIMINILILIQIMKD